VTSGFAAKRKTVILCQPNMAYCCRKLYRDISDLWCFSFIKNTLRP